MFRKIIEFIKNPIKFLKERRRIKKRLAELRERDPFIYK